MKCTKCKEDAVSSDVKLCKDHFISYFEKKVFDTVSKHKLIYKGDKLAVACSGGKDSLSVLYVLSKKYPVEAIVVDEGVSGYRAFTIKTLKEFCKEHSVKLKVYSFKKEFGCSLDKMVKKTGINACTICGILRRYLLNKKTRKYDKIVTGHNLDDEAQSILMNMLKCNLEASARLGLIAGVVKDNKFVTRIKPLYLCTERETMLYSALMGFDVSFNRCPYVKTAFRADVRDLLNDYENKTPGAKKRIVSDFLKQLPKLRKHFYTKESVGGCRKCGEASKSDLCMACQVLDKLAK